MLSNAFRVFARTKGTVEMMELLLNYYIGGAISSSSCLIMCQMLLKRLETQLETAKKSILRASSNGPMYGTLFCLRSLIDDQDLK